MWAGGRPFRINMNYILTMDKKFELPLSGLNSYKALRLTKADSVIGT